MDRNFESKSRIRSRLHKHPASSLLALAVPAALAGVALASYGVSAAPPRAEVAVAKAEAALKNGQHAKAISHAEAAVTADPLNARYRALLGAAYLGAGRFMAAATSFEDALDLGQDDARTVLSYALAKIAIGDARVAVAALDEANSILPAADYGLALALAGQAERGVKVLVNAVRSEEPTPKLRQNLAYAYALSGNWRAARVMAAEDVPAGELDARMVAWAATAAPEQFQQRVASLLKVSPARDSGQPASLALANFRNPTPAAAPALAEAVLAPVPAQPEQLRQSEALAYGFEAISAQPALERIDPSAPQGAPAAAQAVAPAAHGGIRFVSNPVVQALPQAQPRRAAAPAAAVRVPVAAPVAAPAAAAAAAPAPQRRMAATTAASAAPNAAPAAATASDKSLGSHLVQLGSYSSKLEAERGWTALTAKFPQLKEHDVVITEALVNGRTFFRVAAAGFGPKSAASLCGTLKSAGRGCFAYAAANPPAGAVDKGVRMAARSR